MSDPYEQARRVLEQEKGGIMDIKGVQGVAVGSASDYGGDDGPCLVVYLDKEADKGLIAKSLHGYPVFVVDTEGFSAFDD